MTAAWVGACTAVAVAVAAALSQVIRYGWRLMRGTTRFLDEYFGEESHDGVDGKRGVMARLAEHEKLLHALIAETKPNGGTSLRDAVSRIERDVGDIRDEQARLRTQIELRNPPGKGLG